MSRPLVLSLFPGIGLLDMAFEEEGFCVVRGPDLLWGGDIKRFHVPSDRFDGVIGGPPCQAHCSIAKLNASRDISPRYGNLVPEYARVVAEAQPDWFVMENVSGAPDPVVEGYTVHSQLLNNRWLGAEQNRVRRFAFGTRDGRRLAIETVALESIDFDNAVLASETGKGRIGKGRYAERPAIRPIPRQAELMGLPADFFNQESPFRTAAQGRMLGNGVPLPMGRAIAKAVRAAMYPDDKEGAA
jgi:DNA (cytosine-5)-methyltransferase 1